MVFIPVRSPTKIALGSLYSPVTLQFAVSIDDLDAATTLLASAPIGALWDNRLCVHQAFNDTDGYRRELYRTTVAGEVPV